MTNVIWCNDSRTISWHWNPSHSIQHPQFLGWLLCDHNWYCDGKLTRVLWWDLRFSCVINITFFRERTPCCSVDCYQRLRGNCYLHLGVRRVILTPKMGVRVPPKQRCPMYWSTGRNVVVSAGVTSISRHSLSDVTAVNKRNSTNGKFLHSNKTVAVLLNELCSFGKFIWR